ASSASCGRRSKRRCGSSAGTRRSGGRAGCWAGGAPGWAGWAGGARRGGGARGVVDEGDAERRELRGGEAARLEVERAALEQEVRKLLVPRDPNDDKNVILEIRAGTGGEEAALFAADLFRMYARFAERRGWKLEVLHSSESERSGLKELIAGVAGEGAFGVLKGEGGGA